MTAYTRTLPAGKIVTLAEKPCGTTELTISSPLASGRLCITVTLDETTRPWLIRALTVADQAALLDHTYRYRQPSTVEYTVDPTNGAEV